MHDNRKLKTLLACIDDLTHTVNEMAAAEPVHQADQDLLLYHARLFYEALLRLETTAAVSPATSKPVEISEDVADLAVMQGDEGSLVEALSAEVAAAVEEAKESGAPVELDIHWGQAGAGEQKQEQSATESMPEVPETKAEPQEAAVESSGEAMDAPEEVVASAAEAGAPIEAELVEAASAKEPAQMEEVVARAEAHASTPAEARSFAFSLTGIIEKSGESQLVMAHLKLKPIDDLKSGIGLNEKFLFIRELFGNDHLAYAEAIEKLNQAAGIAEAERVLAEDILPKQQWDLDTEAALSFLHLIYRRFAKNA